MSSTTSQQAKTSPHSIEAEQAVLGGFIIAGESLNAEAHNKLEPEYFYRPEHRKIFQAISSLVDNNKPVDTVVLTEKLRESEALEEVGGTRYLIELAENTIGAEQAEAYADIIVDYARLRMLLEATKKINDYIYSPRGMSTDDIVDYAEKLIFAIAERGQSDENTRKIDDLLAEAIERIEELAKFSGRITGLSTGYDDIDEMTDGLHAGELVIVAGRPSMGKTSFAMNIVEHVIANNDDPDPALVFSLEMPSVSLVVRKLASMSRINQQKVRSGDMQADDWARITSSVTRLNDKPLFIDDSLTVTPNDIRTRCRRVARDYGNGRLSLIVIDYLQLMYPDRRSRDENRVLEISSISRALKGLAKEMDCPVMALSQLNRGVEQRQNKRPVMSDLRDSGAIEQDADTIMFIYRDEVYNDSDPLNKGIAEIIIGKQRNGPIGTCRLTFLPELIRFESYTGPDNYEGASSEPDGI